MGDDIRWGCRYKGKFPKKMGLGQVWGRGEAENRTGREKAQAVRKKHPFGR